MVELPLIIVDKHYLIIELALVNWFKLPNIQNCKFIILQKCEKTVSARSHFDWGGERNIIYKGVEARKGKSKEDNIS